jgi:hypothetical protein
MATYYDEKLMDWVGTMDEAQFYAECERSNGKFFRRLIGAWTANAGCFLEWEVWGVSLYARIDGKKVKVCCLAPQWQQAGTKDHLTVTRATYCESIDKDQAEEREREIRAAAGSLAVIGTTQIEIVQPGILSRGNQTALIQALVEKADMDLRRARELAGTQAPQSAGDRIGRRVCPSCAKDINIYAVKCRFCKADL